MANSIREEIKFQIMKYLSFKDKATWSSIVSTVAQTVEVHPMYVERMMGELFQAKKLERHEGRGFPTYSLLAGPATAPSGRVDGKYDDYNQKRLDAIAGGPSKSGTYEENPWNEDIKGPKAV